MSSPDSRIDVRGAAILLQMDLNKTSLRLFAFVRVVVGVVDEKLNGGMHDR